MSTSADAQNVVRQPYLRQGQLAAANVRWVLSLLQTQPLALDALLHAEVSVVLSRLFQQRRSVLGKDAEKQGIDPGLKRAIEKMSVYFYRPWSVGALAGERE